MDFQRQAVELTPPAPEKPAPASKKDRGFSNAAADLLAAQTAPPPAPASSASSAIPIFGSVSTADVANRITHLLSDDQEASRIVLGADDVRFVNVSVEGPAAHETDRVKHLGEYQIQVRIKGADVPVESRIRVVPI